MKALKYVSFHENSGYGIAARRYMTALEMAGVPLTWTPMVPSPDWGLGYAPLAGTSLGNEDLDPIVNRDMDYNTVLLHTVPEYFPLWRRREPGKKIFGYTVWETDQLPPHWPALLNSVDGLFVPCAWNKAVFERCGVTVPIEVIPHILSDSPLPPGENFPGLPDEPYLFYTINTWTERKALWHTIRCFLDTFTAKDPVALVVKTTPRDFTRVRFKRFFSDTRWALRRLTFGRINPAAVHLITRDLTDEEMLQLHARGDCYVSLSRGEGWGMGAFDAAGFGKPVIMTGYGGQEDYLPPALAYRVDYRLVPVRDRAGKGSYRPDQHWAEPDLAHASALMREVSGNPASAREKGAALCRHLQTRFNGPAVAEKMLRCLRARESETKGA